MSVTAVKNETMGYYQGAAIKTEAEQKPFSLEKPAEAAEQTQEKSGEVPDKSAGTSFMDLFQSGRFSGNTIPVVNQIVSSRNPEDGEIYLTYFTDDSITCHRADGREAWEVSIDGDTQAQKVREFFERHTSCRWTWAKELYSGDDMGEASLKSFWLELFRD